MTNSLRRGVSLVLIVAVMSLTACSATYVKQEVMANGSTTTTEVTHGHDWWANLGEPDMMGMKHEKVSRNGAVVYEAACDHEPTHPLRLTCTEIPH